ncbi:MAG: NAD-dependent epimerase/dehydratase family protein [Polyangiaceae bacterium]|nr:NAD-dependent epimerase/dehydratase family protein [Polyangiaceae bacterium]
MRAACARGQGTILITGACGRLGKHLVRALHRERRVVAVDRRPFADKPKDVIHERVDLRRKKLRDVFRSEPIEAVVHLGVMHDPRASQAEHHAWNVAGFQKLLEYVTHFQVPKLVVLSSANVYGPQPGNAQFLDEEAPLLASARFSEIRDLIEVDMLAQGFFWKHPDTETVILRPVHILGVVHNAASNFLRLPTIPTLMGFDPMVQVVHELDVVRALEQTLSPGKRGIYNIAGPEPLPISHIIKLLGRPSIPVPYMFGKAALKRLWNLRLSTFPAPELDHIRYVCMVDDRRARDELGYTPKTSIEDTVRSVDLGRW